MGFLALTMPPIGSQITGAVSSSRPHSSSFPAIARLTACRLTVQWRYRSNAIAVIRIVLLLTLGTPLADAATASANAPNAAEIVDPVAAAIAEASRRFDIPASWIRAVIRVESDGDLHAVSPRSAMGLMQIMPETWASLQLRFGIGPDPFDAHDNILAGAAYLRELHDRYGAGFLAAYNAGPTRYETYLATGRALPNETLAYVDRLARLTTNDAVGGGVVLPAATPSWLEAPLFVPHTNSSLAPVRSTTDRQREQSPIVIRLADLTGLVPQSNGLFAAVSQQSGTR